MNVDEGDGHITVMPSFRNLIILPSSDKRDDMISTRHDASHTYPEALNQLRKLVNRFDNRYLGPCSIDPKA